MKKILLTLAAALFAVSVHAQGTITGGGLPILTTQAAFVTAVNDALTNCYVAQFDGRSKFEMTSPVVFTLKDCGNGPTGFNGNGMQISTNFNTGNGAIKFQTTTAANRSFVLQGFTIFGGAYFGRNVGSCIIIQAPRNNVDIYKFTIRDVYIDFCAGHGMEIVGAVFEGSITNLMTENNNGSGLYMNHGADGGIVSNVFVFGLNASRNHRYGMELASRAGVGPVDSVQAFGPSFVMNALGGILATGGIRNLFGGNCENSGLVCVDIQGASRQSRIAGLEASTDNNTKDSAVPASQPMKYTIRYPVSINALVKALDLTMVCYGVEMGGNCNGVQVRAP
jgi:hypothetical protein